MASTSFDGRLRLADAVLAQGAHAQFAGTAAELGGGERYLVVAWGDGRVTDCRIVDGSETGDATYVLAADFQDWKALHEGYDALRTVMYRKLLLERGDLLEFFKAIYFFVESLALIAKVPTSFPANAEALAST